MKRKVVHFLKQRGFSMVGVLVAAGMAGGLALYMANITKMQHVSQKKAETGAELTGLQHKILSTLYDGEACTKSLGPGSFLPLPGTTQTRSLTQLKNKEGTVVVQTGPGGDVNRMLRVESMTIKDVRGNVGLTREAVLEVTIKRLGEANKGHTTVKKFPITVELQSTPNIIARCHHTLDAKEEGIKESMCLGLGGSFTEASGGTPSKCSLENLFARYCTSLGGAYAPGSPVGTCNIADRYVDADGDTMTGTLQTTDFICQNLSCSGNINAGGNVGAVGRVTAGASPSPLTPTPTCPPGQTGIPPNCKRSIWVNVSDPATSHAQACSTVGGLPGTDSSGGSCACGEARPNDPGITYPHGTYGSHRRSGKVIRYRSGRFYCYYDSGHNDFDATDLVVAYFCRDVP